MLRNENKYNLLNTFFDKIYVLTISRAKERHTKLEQDLAGINYTLFYGVDKMLMNELAYENIYSKEDAIARHRYNKELQKGEIACSIGHKMIYEDVIKNNFNKVLILEDDVIINNEGLNLFDQILNELPGQWDVLYFDYNKNTHYGLMQFFKQVTYTIQRQIGLLKLTNKAIKNLFAKPFSKHLKKAGYHDYASAYAISLKAAKKLVQLQTPVQFPADHVLPYAITNELLIGYITVPKLFIQQSQLNKDLIGSYVEN